MGYCTNVNRACEALLEKFAYRQNGTPTLHSVGLTADRVRELTRREPTGLRYRLVSHESTRECARVRYGAAAAKYQPMIDWLNENPEADLRAACQHFDRKFKTVAHWFRNHVMENPEFS
ncbi:MAG: hypothetical protein AAFX93_00045 [Verrucomicrobiota bacterium]